MLKVGDKIIIKKQHYINASSNHPGWHHDKDKWTECVQTVKEVYMFYGSQRIKIVGTSWAFSPDWCTIVVPTIEELNKEALLKRYV